MSDAPIPLVGTNATIRDCLKIIDQTQLGCCFMVDSDDTLIGIITDGDIRRALLLGEKIETLAIKHINDKCVTSNETESDFERFSKLNEKIKVIPIIDQNGKFVSFFTQKSLSAIPICEPDLSGNEFEYVIDCFKSNWISSKGKYVNKFEEMFSTLHEGRFAVAVSNGTTALHLALKTLGISDGDEVILPSLTFAATANAVKYCNAIPVFCDVDETLCLDPSEVKKLITKKTKCILPVHLYGRITNISEIRNIISKSDIKIIEDCAEAVGSEIHGKKAGTFGDASTFSFFGNKTLTTGEGGMVLFKQKDDANYARLLRDHGMSTSKRYWHEHVGFNYRLTNIQAAIGVGQLEQLKEKVAKKRAIAELYNSILSKSDCFHSLATEASAELNSYWLYTVILKRNINRDEVIKKLKFFGIEARPVFYPLHKMPPFEQADINYNLPRTEFYSEYGLSLPSSLSLNSKQIEYISESLLLVCNSLKNSNERI